MSKQGVPRPGRVGGAGAVKYTHSEDNKREILALEKPKPEDPPMIQTILLLAVFAQAPNILIGPDPAPANSRPQLIGPDDQVPPVKTGLSGTAEINATRAAQVPAMRVPVYAAPPAGYYTVPVRYYYPATPYTPTRRRFAANFPLGRT